MGQYDAFWLKIKVKKLKARAVAKRREERLKRQELKNKNEVLIKPNAP